MSDKKQCKECRIKTENHYWLAGKVILCKSCLVKKHTHPLNVTGLEVEK